MVILLCICFSSVMMLFWVGLNLLCSCMLNSVNFNWCIVNMLFWKLCVVSMWLNNVCGSGLFVLMCVVIVCIWFYFQQKFFMNWLGSFIVFYFMLLMLVMVSLLMWVSNWCSLWFILWNSVVILLWVKVVGWLLLLWLKLQIRYISGVCILAVVVCWLWQLFIYVLFCLFLWVYRFRQNCLMSVFCVFIRWKKCIFGCYIGVLLGSICRLYSLWMRLNNFFSMVGLVKYGFIFCLEQLQCVCLSFLLMQVRFYVCSVFSCSLLCVKVFSLVWLCCVQGLVWVVRLCRKFSICGVFCVILVVMEYLV